MALKPISPLASMEKAWQEGDRLWAERDLVVILTAQALYGKEVVIDWQKRTVQARTGKED